MKKMLLFIMIINLVLASSCEKNSPSIPYDLPRTDVPAQMQGTWMLGNFSMTEYWNQNPGDYLGNALTMAIAFKFSADGDYEQYFTSSSVTLGITTYQQSVSKGTVVIDMANKTITTHPASAHYRRTTNQQVAEERDLRPDEISTVKYFFEAGLEPNGSNVLYLALDEAANPLTFLKK